MSKRYIDAEKIPYIDLNDDMPLSKIRVYIAFKERIDKIPTADVRENVRGEWIEHKPLSFGKIIKGLGNVFECSVCGEEVNCEPCNFCPNCGADMRGES